MPTYEYVCKECGNNFEQFQKMSDEPIKNCPKCGGAVKKIISNFGINFKGSGFYATDGTKQASSCNTKSCNSCNGCATK